MFFTVRGLAACLGAALWLFTSLALADTDIRDLRPDYARPTVIPFPKHAPYDREIATLGKMLFFDPRLSKYQNMSCATCHNPSFGWEAPVARAIGSNNRPLSRHSPTVLNLAWSSSFFWDGRAQTLEEQAAGPIQAKAEMASDFDIIAQRLNAVPTYSRTFDRLFPNQGITRTTIVTALATYERTLVAASAPFDRWIAGDDTALSEQSKRGFSLFVGQAGCATCHSGWNFTDGNFYDIGADLALYAPVVSGDAPSDRPHLKVPSLRNIALRAPYTHLGGIGSLEDMIRHYADSGRTYGIAPLLDTVPFDISDSQIADLVAFLHSLTEEGSPVLAPVLPSN